jgi:hypothetical protein
MTGYTPFNRYAAIVDADATWFVNNAERRHRVRPADPYEIASDTGQRCPATPLPHYALLRRGRYGQIQKLLVPQPYDMGTLEELSEEQAKGVWEAYLPHLARGVRDDFNQTS